MDLHRLEVFCKVVELQSFTKAAEAVLLSQPTVSEHIRTLEDMFGQRLVDRLGREVLPTAGGRILYRYAQNMLRLRDEALQALEKFKGGLAGHLTLGASTIPGTYILPNVIGAFKARFPSIQVTVRISGTARIVESLLQGELELGLIGSRWNDPRLQLAEIFSDELVLAIFPDHPWAQATAVNVLELVGQPFILRERGSGTRTVMAAILVQHGVDLARLSVVAEMGSTEAVRQAIKARIGISILSRQAVAEDLDRGSLIALPIEGIHFFRPFYLVQRKNRQLSPLSLAFLDHLREAASAPGPFPGSPQGPPAPAGAPGTARRSR
jgi:DNA-binding transcriptional LysR family regulator